MRSARLRRAKRGPWLCATVCLMLVLSIAAAVADGQSVQATKGTATIVDASGETTRVTEIRSVPSVQLEVPLKGGYLEYGSLFPRLDMLIKVVHLGSPNRESCQIVFRDGLTVVGSLRGKLDARTSLGSYSIDWSDIKEFTWVEVPTSAVAGDRWPQKNGAEASVSLDSSSAPGWKLDLELWGVKLWYMYVSGNTTGPGYTRTLEALPLVLSDGVGEVDVPFALIDSFARAAKAIYTTSFTLKLLSNPKPLRESFIGEISSLRETRVFNSPELRGYDGHGFWNIHVHVLSNVRFRPGTSPLAAPGRARVGTVSTWENQRMTVESATGNVVLAKGSGTVDIELGKVASVQSTKLPASKSEYHLAILMRDGTTVDGTGHIAGTVSAMDESGLSWLLRGPAVQFLNLQQ